jgi:hypothetical protein
MLVHASKDPIFLLLLHSMDATKCFGITPE